MQQQNKKITGRSYVFTMLFLVLILLLPIAAAAKTINIDILSINDFHGALLENGQNPGAAKLTAFLLDKKAQNPKGTLIVSGGDMFQGSVRSNILYGQPVVNMMNIIQFDAMAFGNHEFDWGVAVMKLRNKEAKFPWIAANILEVATEKPISIAKPYVIVKKQGVKIALIGLTTPETAKTTNLNVARQFIYQDPKQAMDEILPSVRRDGADVIVVVAHLGSKLVNNNIIGEAADLANHLKGVDAIVSAHTHEKVFGRVNGIQIVQAGALGRAVGHIKLDYSTEQKAVVAASSEVLTLDRTLVKPHKKVTQIMDKYAPRAALIEKTVIGSTVSELTHDRYTFSLLGEVLTDYMREVAAVDVAFINGGGIRRSLAQGNITLGDLYAVEPFDNNLITMQMTGEQIKEVLEYGLGNGKYGYLQVSGLRIVCDPNAPIGKKLLTVNLKSGSPLDDKQLYTVATNNFLLDGGDGYTMFKKAKNIVDTNKVIRDVFAEAIKKAGKLNMKSDGRIQAVPKAIKDAA